MNNKNNKNNKKEEMTFYCRECKSFSTLKNICNKCQKTDTLVKVYEKTIKRIEFNFTYIKELFTYNIGIDLITNNNNLFQTLIKINSEENIFNKEDIKNKILDYLYDVYIDITPNQIKYEGDNAIYE